MDLKSKFRSMFSRWTALGILCFHVFFAIGITIMPAKVYAAVPTPMYFLPFNGNFADQGGSNKPVSPGPAAAIFNDPVRGKVLSLTGYTGGYVLVTNALPSSYTKAAWVKLGLSTIAGHYSILSDGFISTNNSDFLWVTNGTFGGSNNWTLKAGPRETIGGTFANAVWATGSLPTVTTGTFPTGQWVHVAVTYDGTSKGYRLYQSGVLVGIGTGTTSTPFSSGQVIGAYASNQNYGSSGYNSNWSGWIDDVRLWDSVLTPSQIAEVMSDSRSLAAPTNVGALSTGNGRVRVNWDAVSATPAVTDYMIEYKLNTGSVWQTFSDGVSTNTNVIVTGLISPLLYNFRVSAINASGAGLASTGVSAEAGVPEPQFLLRFNGNYNDSTSNAQHGINIAVAIATEPVRGQVGAFTGTTSYVTILTGFSTGASFSRAGWIQATGLGFGGSFFFRAIFGNDGGSFFWLNGSNPASIAPGHAGSQPVVDPVSFPLGSWMHVAMTYEAPTKKYTIYKNGAYVASGISGTDPAVSAPTSGTRLGLYPGVSTWLGYMDDMEQWSGALSSGQMQAVYEGNLGLISVVPTAPTALLATGSSGQAIVSFTLPSYDGGSPILYYAFSGSPGTIRLTGAGSPMTITGLTNGTTYSFQIAGITANGTGDRSALSNNVTPLGLPNAPTALLATGGSGQAIVSFTAPTYNGGASILYYVFSGSPGNVMVTGTNNPMTITGLTNGSGYTFQVAAVNGAGTGAWSIISNSVTPMGLANAPTSLLATGSSGQAIVSFTPPTYTGGSNILYYILTGAPGGIVLTGTGSPLTVTGLTNGTTYTFRIAAVNAAGTGDWSVISNTVTPLGLPNAPTSLLGTGGSGQAIVSFTPPSYNGGSAISYYIMTGSPGSIVVTGTGSPITVTGLTNGTTYTFRIAGVNAAGTGDRSIISNSVTPLGFVNAPTGLLATGSSGQAIVSFTAPTYDGGSSIMYYIFSGSPGSIMVTGNGNPMTITGLTNGTAYTFQIAAVNGAGTGDRSIISNSVTPLGFVNAPTSLLATGGSGQAIVSFTAPTYNGGSAISYYILTGSPGDIVLTGIGSPLTVTGLTNGTAYTFRIAAINAAGTGDRSAISNSVIPLGLPTAPTSLLATGASGQAIVSFTPPSYNGGGSILYYVFSGSPGSIMVTGNSNPMTITGLTNGIAYAFRIAAVNGAGTGDWSILSNAVAPITVPHITPNVVAVAGSGYASISFDPPANDGGTGIIEYLVVASPGSFFHAGTGSPILMSGLTNGITYSFTVAARNAVGYGPISNASNFVTPATVPNAPTNVAATSTSGQAIVSFSGSTYSGGSNILYYVVTSSTGNISFTGTESPITMTGLTNGIAYTFTVVAVNGLGTGAVSIASNSVTPVGLPNGPTNVSAVGGNHEATISFSGSTYTGGSNILYYVVTSSPGDITFTGTGSPITVMGLTNGIPYIFIVAAVNGLGTGAGGSSNAVTPFTIPNAPTSVTAATGNESATISFVGSTDDGGYSILYYIVTSTPGGISFTGLSSPITVEGLANGTPYTFKVAARTAMGTGVASVASNSVTPVTVPGVPQNIQGAGTNGEAIFDFDPPLVSGGSAILSYRIRTITGSIAATSGSSPMIVTGFMNGTTHTFFISAVNAQGEGTSGPVTFTITTPTTAPGSAPQNLTGLPGSGSAKISFEAPLDNGGLLIDYYRIRSSTGILITTGATSPVRLTGLVNGDTYTFYVSAVNPQGEGPSGSVIVTPVGLFAYDTGVILIPGASTLIANWMTTIRASSQIQYSISMSYSLNGAETDTDIRRVTSHSGNIRDLLTCTTYNARFIGSDEENYRYTGSNFVFTTLGCANNAPIITQEQTTISVPVGGIFSMTSDIATILEVSIPADIIASVPELIFQGKQLVASTAMGELGSAGAGLQQVGSLYDLQAYSGENMRITNFDTGMTMTLSYRDEDISQVDESTLVIYSHNGTSWSELDNCIVDSVANTVTCETTHFSNFSLFGVILAQNTPLTPINIAFGGGGYPRKDTCPNGDYSLNNYDHTCSSVSLPNVQDSILRTALNKCRALKGEEKQSYCFNRAIGSTTMNTFAQARYYDQITRAQLAKIMGEFAKNIMGKVPDKAKQCMFTGEDPDGLAPYMIQACQLGLMNTMRPNEILTRGEYMTVLSRMLYGKTYEQTNVESETHPFYEYHMEQLYKEGLIKIKEPMLEAQRFVPFLTLYRLAQKLDKETR